MGNQDTEVVHLRLPRNLYKVAKDSADLDGRTLSNLLRRVIERHFEVQLANSAYAVKVARQKKQ